MSTPNPTHIIADVLRQVPGVDYYDFVAAVIMKQLTDAGYSIVPTEPDAMNPEHLRFAAAVVADSFETGDWDRPRSGRRLMDIATYRSISTEGEES